MFDQVWSKVVHGRYESFPALAPQLIRLAVPGETYPAAVSHQSGNIQGLVWQNVSPADLQRLDGFEGREYSRVPVEVLPLSCIGVSAEMIKPLMAWIYLWNQPELLDFDKPWDVEQFKSEGLPLFLAKHVGSWQQSGTRN
jgi:hypothetical protein